MASYRVNIDVCDGYELSGDSLINTIIEYRNVKKELLDNLVKANIKLVLSISNRYSNRKESMDDIFQVGCIGLIKAINNFDLNLGLQFSTYAVPMISGEIKRYLRDNGSMKVSRQIKDLAYQILKYKEDYYNDTGIELDMYDISSKLNVPICRIKEAMDSTMDVCSIFDKIKNKKNDDLFLIDSISDISDSYEKRLNKYTLYQGISSLNELEKKIIYDRYYNDKTQEELAKELMVSQAQISRLEKGAIKTLKSFF